MTDLTPVLAAAVGANNVLTGDAIRPDSAHDEALSPTPKAPGYAVKPGELIRTGGRVTKSSSGYDLTQLIIGSEGTLALVTEAVLKLQPRPAHSATVLAPFAGLDAVIAAVPKIVASGLGPNMLEYIDA